MRPLPLFFLLIPLAISFPSKGLAEDGVTHKIITNAEADGIDLTVLHFLPTVLTEIEELFSKAPGPAAKRSLRHLLHRQTPNPNDIVDVHTHVVPSWYRTLYPSIGGFEVPDWTMEQHLAFMADQGIERGVFSFSTPGPNVFLGQKFPTLALARLLNEQAAAYCHAYPGKFNFYAQVPLPYTAPAIREAQYAINHLGAVGIWVQSSIEGKYLGDPGFKAFFQTINSWAGRQIVVIHPGIPYMHVGDQFLEANPTAYMTGVIEFFFETSRTLMDLTLTQTIHNFTNIHYVIPHVGGAFPATMDRILKRYPAIYDSSFAIYSTRFWWDSAGPTYDHQVAGLLGYNIPKSQLLYGTDFPYAPPITQAGSLAAVKNSPLFTAAEKVGIFRTNAQNLFGSKIDW